MRKKSKTLLSILIIVVGLFHFLGKPALLAASDTPATLEILSQTQVGNINDLEVEGNYLYLSGSEKLKVLDVSDPNNPVFSGVFTKPGCNFTAVDVVNNLGYVTQLKHLCSDGTRTLHILDVSNPSSPIQINSDPILIPSYYPVEILTEGGYAYIVNGRNKLTTVDISVINNPIVYPLYNIPGSRRFYDLEKAGDYIYLSSLTGGFAILNVSDPSNVQLVNDVDFPTGVFVKYHPMGIDVQENKVYLVTQEAGLKIFDVADPTNAYEISTTLALDRLRDIEVVGNYAFIAAASSGTTGFKGVLVYDVSNPKTPSLVDSYALTGSAYKIAVSEDLVFVWDKSGQLSTLRFSGLQGGKKLDVPLFKQTDPAWGELEYDSGNSQSLKCGSTIASCGCATSSIAMVLKYYGIDLAPDGKPTTPEAVNDYFKRNQLCDENLCISDGYRYGNVRWTAAGQYSAEANAKFGTQKIILSGLGDYSFNEVGNRIIAGNPSIIEVPGIAGGFHWVVAKGRAANTVMINDSYYERYTLDDPAYGNSALAMRSFEKTASDFSSFEATSLAPAQLLVTDSQGRKTGFDPQTNTVVENIPNSYYYFEESYTNPSEENPIPSPGTGVYTVLILTPKQDDYEVEVVSLDNELYSFSVHASDSDASLVFDMYEGVEENGEDHIYQFNYDPTPGSDILVQELEIDILPKKDLNQVKIKPKSGKTIPVAILSTPTFNAPNQVDWSSLTFGKTGDEDSLRRKGDERSDCKEEDVNKDGFKDLKCRFYNNKTGLQKGDAEVILKGESIDGIKIQGGGSVIVQLYSK